MRNPFEEHSSLRVLSALRSIRARAWLMLAAVLLVVLGLLAWAAIALLSWLWGQFPTAADAGKRFASEAVTQVEQVAPGLKEQVGQWVPEFAGALPSVDVSGTDIGPVPRFPGLIRSYYAQTEKTMEARYSGRADFDSVRAHYVQGFTNAGYAHEVAEATLDMEHHRFTAGQEVVELMLMRNMGDRVDVRLKVPAQ